MKLWIWQTFGFWQIPSICRFFGEQLSQTSQFCENFTLAVFDAQSIFRMEMGGRMWQTWNPPHSPRRILEDSTTWEEEIFSTQKRHENLSHFSAFVWQRHPSPTTKKSDGFSGALGDKLWRGFCFSRGGGVSYMYGASYFCMYTGFLGYFLVNLCPTPQGPTHGEARFEKKNTEKIWKNWGPKNMGWLWKWGDLSLLTSTYRTSFSRGVWSSSSRKSNFLRVKVLEIDLS